jgi:hypothetical protein
MKIMLRTAALCFALLLPLTYLGGCWKETGMQRSEKTSNTMEAVQQDYQQALVQIDATNASLDTLLKAEPAGLKSAFAVYTDNAAKMDDKGKVLLKHSEKMRAQGLDYFDEMRKEGNAYTNPDIQKLSEERRARLSEVFAKIAASGAGVKGSLTAYLSDIRQIQTYLSNDLTPKGVASITPVAEKTMDDGNNLKNDVQPVLSAIEFAKGELSQEGAAAGGSAPSPQPR